MIKAYAKKVVPRSMIRIWNMKYCPVTMPWFYKAGKVGILKKIELKEAINYRLKNKERIQLIIDPFFWPLISTFHAICNISGSKGKFVLKEFGIPRLKQFIEQIWFANRHNIGCHNYYIYRLWTHRGISYNEPIGFSPLFSALHEKLNTNAEKKIIDDKVAFYEHCIANNLPTINIIAIFKRNEKIKWLNIQPGHLPYSAVFLKPTQSYGGHGAERWIKKKNLWHNENKLLTEEEMIKYCQKLSDKEDYILSELILNDREMLNWTTGAVPAIRVITCISEDGTIQLLSSDFRIPVNNSSVSNASGGGLVAAISKQGYLGNAIAWEVTGGSFSTHPNTKHRINGELLPRHNDTIDLCLKAHKTLPDFFSIGWDVAITPDGPILIEGNLSWLPACQIAAGHGLSETKFVDWAFTRLERLGYITNQSFRY